MKYDNVRDKTLDRCLAREECDDKDVYEFLKLIKNQGGCSWGINAKELMIEDKWVKVVQHAKRKSA